MPDEGNAAPLNGINGTEADNGSEAKMYLPHYIKRQAMFMRNFDVNRVAPLLTILGCVCCCNYDIHNHDRFRNCDGKAQALDDINQKAPLKIYYGTMFNAIINTESPGLKGCSPEDMNGRITSDKIFSSLPELGSAEGVKQASRQEGILDSAWKFARSYNQTIFRLRYHELLRFCPEVRLTGSP